MSFLENLPPAFARRRFVRWVIDFVFVQMPAAIRFDLENGDEPEIAIVSGQTCDFGWPFAQVSPYCCLAERSNLGYLVQDAIASFHQ